MAEFLKLLSTDQAKDVFYRGLGQPALGTEIIDAQDALGRVISEELTAKENIPAFARSSVDGYALRSKDTFGASESLPAFFRIVGEVGMGKPAALRINTGEAAVIHTGGMLPDEADAVIMLENTQAAIPGEIEVMKAIARNENVILPGEDVSLDMVVFGTGHVLRAGDIGALMALGLTRVPVYKIPKVGIISSGDEIVIPAQELLPGQVRDVNSFSLSALIQHHGGAAQRYGIVPDEKEALMEVLHQAHAENDLVIVTAGSSASVRDITAEAIDTIGRPGVLVHGVNVKPGKPTILAVCDGKPVVGLPGNPLSAYVIALIFVTPLLRKLRGEAKTEVLQKQTARLAVNVASAAGREDWLPVRLLLNPETGAAIAEPIFFKSNLIFSVIRADGFLRIPADITGYSANVDVEITLA